MARRGCERQTLPVTLTDPNRLFSDYLAGPRVEARLPEGWVDEPYTRFAVDPLSPTIGAVIDGVSLAQPVDDELFGELNRALLEWKVIFFRGQDITGDQHTEFAGRWGPLETHPFIRATVDQPEERPQVVRFEKGHNLGGYENVWHSDVTWRERPSLGSVLRAIEVPAVGGDTLWDDMGATYDGLRNDTKTRIEGCAQCTIGSPHSASPWTRPLATSSVRTSLRSSTLSCAPTRRPAARRSTSTVPSRSTSWASTRTRAPSCSISCAAQPLSLSTSAGGAGGPATWRSGTIARVSTMRRATTSPTVA